MNYRGAKQANHGKLRIAPNTTKRAIMPHTTADCQRYSDLVPVFTYRTPVTAITAANSGSSIINNPFARIAAAKSIRSNARHIRLTPHAGQYSPVSKCTGQGIASPVVMTNTA